MSLLGIDIGTSGCKAIAFTARGETIGRAQAEYDVKAPRSGYAELDTNDVWEKVRRCIRDTARQTGDDPIEAISIASIGEAVVPVSKEKEILGPSILFIDLRGEEYVDVISASVEPSRVYEITGNSLGAHYTLPKLMWIKDHDPELYRRTDRFLLWGGFVAYMLGAEPAVDYSLANRTLCFDIDRCTWSEEMLAIGSIDRSKLPDVVPSGTLIGRVSREAALELDLPEGAAIVAGGHDQCVNATGAGVLESGQAMYGMGTFLCAAPVYERRIESTETMLRLGLNTEHHTRADRFVSFIYNQSGCLVKWFRDTFAASEHREDERSGRDTYERLFAEVPDYAVGVTALPYFTGTGPPSFYPDPTGTIAGLELSTTRGEILKGIVQGITFYLKRSIAALPEAGVGISEFRAVGGGSKSDAWLQASADILGIPLTRAVVTEAGALGAAVIAGVGAGLFPSMESGVSELIALGKTFSPADNGQYDDTYQKYLTLESFAEEQFRSRKHR